MSYEGHYQALCEKGHQAHFNALYSVDEEQAQRRAWKCPAMINNAMCGAGVGAINSVDDTNCESWGIRKFIKLTDEEVRVCSFGHKHIWTAATFKFSDEQYYYDSESGKLVELK